MEIILKSLVQLILNASAAGKSLILAADKAAQRALLDVYSTSESNAASAASASAAAASATSASNSASAAIAAASITSTGSQFIGVSPATGTNAAGGTYILGSRPVNASGYITKIQIYAGASATVKIKRFTRSGQDFTLVSESTVSVVSGLNTFDSTLASPTLAAIPVVAGEYLAIYSATAGFVKYNAVASQSGTEYYTGVTDLSTLTVAYSALPASTVQLQVGFTLAYVQKTVATQVTAEQYDYGQSITLGPDTPAAGSTPNLSTVSTFFDDQRQPQSGLISSIVLHSTASGVINIFILTPTLTGYALDRTFMLAVVSGVNTFLAGTHYPNDMLVKQGGLIGHRAMNTSLSSSNSNARRYKYIDGNPAAVTTFTGVAASQQHQIKYVTTVQQANAKLTDRSPIKTDYTFSSIIHPQFNSVNWSISGGVATNSSTGLASYLEYGRGGYYNGTFRVWYQFTGGSDEIAVYRKPNTGESLGTVCTINASTGLMAFRAAWGGSGTLPASVTSKTCGFAFTTGRTYRVDLIKDGTTLHLTVTDTITGNTDTLDSFSKDGIGGHSTACGFAVGNPGVAAITGTITVSRTQFRSTVADPRVIIFGDSIVESSGATLDSTGWAQQVVAAVGGVISAHAGNGSGNVLARLETELRQFSPRHVIILIGTNDTVTATWQANIDLIILRILRANAVPWICTVPAESGDANPENIMNPYLRTTYPTYLIQMDRALTTGGTGLSANRNASLYQDTLHPNDAGHAAMYARARLDAPVIFDI